MTASGPATGTDWVEWHRRYEDPASVLSRRLELVVGLLATALDEAPAGPLRLLSLCAGDGRDVLSVLGRHPRADDVTARLVELDEVLAARAASRARAQGREGQVTVVVADAGRAQHLEQARPVDVLLACGVFGNVTAEDLRRTVTAFGDVVARGGTVLWTRHRRAPDQTPDIRSWFEEAGFEELAFLGVPDSLAAVGLHRHRDAPRLDAPLPDPLFCFVGDGSGAHV